MRTFIGVFVVIVLLTAIIWGFWGSTTPMNEGQASTPPVVHERERRRQERETYIVVREKLRVEHDAMETAALIELMGKSGDYPDGAIDSLRRRGVAAAPELIESLQSGHPVAAPRAAQLLGEIRAEGAIPWLALSMKAGGYESVPIIRALGMIGGTEAAAHLMAALPNAPPTSQGHIMRALAVIGDSRAMEPIVQALAHGKSAEARAVAAEVLGRFPDPRARAALEESMETAPEWHVYHAAKRSLQKIGASRYYLPSISHLEDDFRDVKKMVIPPEGIDATIDDYYKDNEPQWDIFARSFLPRESIEEARDSILLGARGGLAESIVEELMHRSFGNQMLDKSTAKSLIIEIGEPAIPALRKGMEMGDKYFARDCEKCIEQIQGKTR